MGAGGWREGQSWSSLSVVPVAGSLFPPRGPRHSTPRQFPCAGHTSAHWSSSAVGTRSLSLTCHVSSLLRGTGGLCGGGARDGPRDSRTHTCDLLDPGIKTVPMDDHCVPGNCMSLQLGQCYKKVKVESYSLCLETSLEMLKKKSDKKRSRVPFDILCSQSHFTENRYFLCHV